MKMLLSILVVLATSLYSDVQVVTVNEGVKTGFKVDYGAGNILLFPKEGSDFKHRIGRQNVKAVIQRETTTAKFLRNAFLEGKFPAIASETGEDLCKKNFHTGWGKKSAFYLAMSFIKNNKLSEAEKVIKESRTYIPGENETEDRILLNLASKYLAFAKNNKNLKLTELDSSKVPESNLGKLYYYKLQGQLLERDNKESLAVLSYYKGIFLGVKSEERKILLSKIEAIYKKQQDPRKLPDLNNL